MLSHTTMEGWQINSPSIFVFIRMSPCEELYCTNCVVFVLAKNKTHRFSTRVEYVQ